jgi:hypothetical protein
VRGDPSITWIDVKFPVDVKFPLDPAALDSPGVLLCVDDPASLTMRKGYDPATNTTRSPAGCDNSHHIQQFKCEGLPTCGQGDDKGLTQIPNEPFGMAIDESKGANRLLVSHLTSGQVSVISTNKIDDNTKSLQLLSESSAFFPADSAGRHGAFALAQQNPSDPHSLWYLTSNVNPQMATFRVSDSNLVIQTTLFGVPSFARGVDLRDIHFDPSGNRAFVTENDPPSVVVLDTRPQPNTGGFPANIVTDIIDVCQTPSHMGVRRVVRAGAPGEPVQLKTKLVVVCFLSSQVMLVDPDRPGVDDTIFSGFSGPDDITFNFPNDGDAEPKALTWAHAYVTNYSESTIAVVDLQPGSPTENRVIARLGFPPGGPTPQ